MTISNKLTILRIVMIPLFLVFMFRGGDIGLIIAAVIFLLAALTDFFDGYIARKRNEVTVFGKIFDPIADKVLILSALVPLVEFGLLPTWVAVVLLAREFIIGGFRNAITAQGGQIIVASKLAKIKTIMQDTMIIYLILMKPVFSFITFPIDWILIIIAVVLTLWSMANYIIDGYKQLNFGKD